MNEPGGAGSKLIHQRGGKNKIVGYPPKMQPIYQESYDKQSVTLRNDRVAVNMDMKNIMSMSFSLTNN
jgi:hypothetical protein